LRQRRADLHDVFAKVIAVGPHSAIGYDQYVCAYREKAEMAHSDRISSNPAIFGGKPIMRGMCVSVEMVLSLLAQGETQDVNTSILSDGPSGGF